MRVEYLSIWGKPPLRLCEKFSLCLSALVALVLCAPAPLRETFFSKKSSPVTLQKTLHDGKDTHSRSGIVNIDQHHLARSV